MYNKNKIDKLINNIDKLVKWSEKDKMPSETYLDEEAYL